MAVKVGNSWVSEAAYTYAKAKQEGSGTGSMLSQLSEKFQGTNFSTNTAPFSAKGVNNIAIAPNILAEMEQNPEKKLEYEALIYDCVSLEKSLISERKKDGLQDFGFIIEKDGGLRAWSISKSSGSKEKNRFQCMLPKQDKTSWKSRIAQAKKKASSGRVNKEKSVGVLDIRA